MFVRMGSTKDAAAVLSVYQPYLATPITFELELPPVAEMERRIDEVLRRFPWLLAVESDRVLGYAYGHAFRDRPAYRWSVETSVYVDQNAQRKGIGTALYSQLLAMLKAQGYVSCMAGVTLPNAASVALHERFGFKPVGACRNIGYKNGAWHDVGFFELELNAPVATPVEPLPLSAVAHLLPQPANK